MNSKLSRVGVVLSLVWSLPGIGAGQVQFDSNTFGGLHARSIGPAVMSGRIAALDAIGEDPLTIYAGAATGGVWKSKDGGITWKPIFDDHPQSIGAIRIDPSNPDVVWVGTGESWTRNSVSVGAGLYKTTDAGDSWALVGLEDSERIARIVVSSRNGDTVFVCATGQLWSANEERGVFKTVDGGASWEKVLYVDQDTGCSDIAIDPQDPDTLYAAMWQFRRYPDFFESGGPGSGLYKSTDGGRSWRELADGLPKGDKGRIAVAVAPSRPNRVYAVVESENTALYKSDDLGQSWEMMNNSFAVQGRPFYFAYVVVDPVDFERVYKPGYYLAVSSDSGRSFSSLIGGGFRSRVHPDHHALWINPSNPHELVLGTDGGVYMSYNRGNQFRMIKALPLSQFYEVSYDMDWPYNVYGGLQDNNTWMGPSRAAGGVQNRHWKVIGTGDGFHAYRDFDDPNIVYVEYQGGRLQRYHLATEEVKAIAPLPGGGEPEYRFNWNAPLHLSRNSPSVIYFGAQYLFRSADKGESWERISPDLTTNDPRRQRQKESGGLSIDNTTAENNTTIYTISESPLDGQVIWVGTDDGLVQVTRDGGDTWTNVTANLPELPEGLWVSHVEASPHHEAAAHVTVDGHRSGDMSSYVYRTTDFGATWQSIVGEGLESFAHVVVQDPIKPDLMFVGTESGLYISLDGGQQWARFEGGMPKVPVRDIDIHPRDHDLIIGTHGRGIYILDDLTPLRSLSAEILDSNFALLPSRDAIMVLSGGLSEYSGHDEFVGSNPPEAASLFFYQKKRHIFGDLKIEIYDPQGQLVSTIPAPKVRGLNRADWPMRLPPPKMPPAATLVFAFLGPRVPEGVYTYKVIKGKETFEGTVNLVPDPRSPHSVEDRQSQQQTALDLYHKLQDLTYLVETLLDIRDQAEARAQEAGAKSGVGKKLQRYIDEVDELQSSLVSSSAGVFADDPKLREDLGNLFGDIVRFDGRPTRSQLDRTEFLGEELERVKVSFATITTTRDLSQINSQLEGRGLDPIRVMSREQWDVEQEKSGGGSTGVASKSWVRELAQRLWLPLGGF